MSEQHQERTRTRRAAEPAMTPDELQRFLDRLAARLDERLAERLARTPASSRRRRPGSTGRITLSVSTALVALALMVGWAVAPVEGGRYVGPWIGGPRSIVVAAQPAPPPPVPPVLPSRPPPPARP